MYEIDEEFDDSPLPWHVRAVESGLAPNVLRTNLWALELSRHCPIVAGSFFPPIESKS
jgi:hypothetical protein